MLFSATDEGFVGKDTAVPQPTRVENQEFEKQTVRVDGKGFHGCKFVDCTINFAGLQPTGFDTCEFHNCRFELGYSAKLTIEFLRAIYLGFPGWGSGFVDNVIDHIQSPPAN